MQVLCKLPPHSLHIVSSRDVLLHQACDPYSQHMSLPDGEGMLSRMCSFF